MSTAPPNYVFRSWKTTVAGVVAFLTLLFGQLNDIMQAGPGSFADFWRMFDFNSVIAQAAILFGFLKTRDDDVSSEGNKLEKL